MTRMTREYNRKEHMKTRIQEVRKSLNITQKELSEKTGLSERQIIRIESNKEDTKISTLINIAAALNTTVGNLIYET